MHVVPAIWPEIQLEDLKPQVLIWQNNMQMKLRYYHVNRTNILLKEYNGVVGVVHFHTIL